MMTPTPDTPHQEPRATNHNNGAHQTTNNPAQHKPANTQQNPSSQHQNKVSNTLHSRPKKGTIKTSVGWVDLGKYNPTNRVTSPTLGGHTMNNPALLNDARRLLARETFTVKALPDPLVETYGWPATSDQTMLYLLPIIGPTCLCILHRLSAYATNEETTWTPHDFAVTFGIGNNDHLALAARSLARLAAFDMAKIHTTDLAIRTHIGPLPERWITRLPPYLINAYRNTTAA